MQKLLSVIMVTILLLVSAVPMSVAKECATPAAGGQAVHTMHAGGGHAVHHQMQPPLTDRQISIAHCCNFHGAIDTLPHLLAPCVVADISLAPVLTVARDGSLHLETGWPAPRDRVPLPPPQFTTFS